MSARVEVGYAAALEKYAPAEAVELAALAEQHGFVGTLATDHFQPWLPGQGQAPFVWSVLTALGERTSSNFGPGMAVPGYRYHPATLAQAAATLASMYEGRHWLGIGPGEALNEHVTASYWPEASDRINSMFEAIDLIKKLFAASIAGRDTRFAGTFHRMESTRLWTMPAVAPPVLVATSGPVTARRAGKIADGIVTVGTSYDRAATLLERFDLGVRESGRDPRAMLKVLHLNLSWAPTQEEAMAHAIEQWPLGAMAFPKGDIRSPQVFEQMARLVGPEGFDDRMLISSDVDAHRARVQKFADIGFDRIYLHNVGLNQRAFIQTFGAQVLPTIG
ncbi:TIGR03557 family F420-dependent LLM class oxidoreductase [Aeromicrobium wangtongii]|uniref:TIGR03557 family F420-dependent LLM class oxidoreductase n=1 Tax=Aeromicrobium wangtongii TaxID=2969247 RepID=A0ABY5M7C5_9ACTN|nr:TIGR03557 family F420-dependent LLM class oxidoreductase [Aeromicrobium wangtongii]MCD9198926.1 TIGR03557 family F420-dependent LLM class oxidoreductase [Aeromicrobium wangtongii]UUP13036.1 TIGR03557 family F420-dependent LLM class oxidoreductase [Aeromicrobium wangtongii]